MKSNKGITLIALIITIIVLLILVAVSIDIAIDGKLFDRSKETVSQANNKLGEEQNRVDSLINEWDNLETGISGNTSGNEPEDTTPPTVEIEIQGKTSNSITINVTARDNESGMVETPIYTYYIKKSTESTYEEKTSNNNASYTFTGLTQGVTYDIKVEVQGDVAGNKGKGTTQATTGTVTSGLEQGAITFGNTTWSNNQASVTINTNTSYTIEYQVNSIAGTWTTIANGGTVSGLNHGDTVYARLTDGINAGQHASASIKDETAPIINSFTVTSADTTSITVSASATDNESGIYSYQFQYKLSTASNYTTATTTVTSDGTCTYTYTGLADNTTYNLRVIVTDKANNTKEATTNQTTVSANVGPVIATVAYNNKTTNSIKVTARATDANGDNLTYTLYTSTSENGSYTQKATTSATQNTTVTLNATGLSNYTTYWWYIQVSDGEALQTSYKQSTRTYCPGTGLICNGTSSCSVCDGKGYTTSKCPGKYGEATLEHGPTVTPYNVSCRNCGGTIGKYTRFWTWLWRCPVCSKGVKRQNFYCSEACALTCPSSDECRTAHTGENCINSVENNCSSCNASGLIKGCRHGYSTEHEYCSHNGVEKVGMHDD